MNLKRNVIIIGIIFLIVLGFCIYLFSKNIAQLQTTIESQQQQLTEIQGVVEALVSGNQELAEKLSDEQATRVAISLAQQSEKEAFQDRIENLQSDLSKQQQAVEAGDISNVVKVWSPKVGKISCTRTKNDGNTSRNHGSGTLMMYQGEPYVLTSKHVITEENTTSITCKIFLPESDVTLALSSSIISADSEKAYIKIAKPDAVPASLSLSLKTCNTKPLIGDQVVTLGYPSVGSSNSITATEGIISGFDDGYYVSSAKIEHGNSGGAAILMKDMCFVGIPTLVVQGKIEALARILPVE